MLALIGGAYPGFAPAIDESQAPIAKIQNALVEHFGVDYVPTIMQLSYYKDAPVYYSLNKPTLFKGRKTTTIKDLRELKYLTDEVLKSLGGENSPCRNTEVYNILTDTNFDYYHYKPGKFGEIQSSEVIQNVDTRFGFTFVESKKDLQIATAGQFLRGCIRFSRKSEPK